MTKTFGRASLLVMAGLFALAPSWGTSADAAEVRVIVNAANTEKAIARGDLSNLFLKRLTQWRDGQRAVPVDQPTGTEANSAFCRVIHGKSGGAIKAYWEQKIFSGADVPPAVKQTEAEIVAFVRSNRGAVGYVSSDVSIEGVAVVTIK